MQLLEEKKRREGNLEAILSGMMSESSIFRFQAICGAINNMIFNKAVETQLKRLVSDGTTVMGYSISQLAIAALDRFGVIKYEGKDPTILRLMKADKWFDR